MTPTSLRTLLRAAFIGALLLAFAAALLPAPNTPVVFTAQDKAGHFVAFLALGLLGLGAWPARPSLIIVTLLLYGCAMEVAQSFTDHRHGDPWDWVADALGVGAAVVLQRIWRKSTNRPNSDECADPGRAKAQQSTRA